MLNLQCNDTTMRYVQHWQQFCPLLLKQLAQAEEMYE
jgi:hypothetical protein